MENKAFSQLKHKTIKTNGTLVVKDEVRDWCCLSYPGCPDGCPMYDTRAKCPPRVLMVSEMFNLSRPHYFKIIRFDLAAHAAYMKKKIKSEKGKNWTEKQCRCSRYWQSSLRKRLREMCANFIFDCDKLDAAYSYTLLPEAMGVHVFATCRKHGIKLHRNPQNIVYSVAFIGKLTEEGREYVNFF